MRLWSHGTLEAEEEPKPVVPEGPKEYYRLEFTLVATSEHTNSAHAFFWRYESARNLLSKVQHAVASGESTFEIAPDCVVFLDKITDMVIYRSDINYDDEGKMRSYDKNKVEYCQDEPLDAVHGNL